MDRALSIAVDPSGDAYIAGMTGSTDFPTTPGAFVSACTGSCADAFVTKLDSVGSLVYSARFGGDYERATRGEGIAVDADGNAYVTGSTQSEDFPTLIAFQPHLGGGWCDLGGGVEYDCDDEFVTKLNPDGSGLVYSTYLGGSGGEHSAGMAVDSYGAAYVAGGTFITDDFPMANPIQGHYGGGTCGEPPDTIACFDANVAKLSPSGELLFSTYLGGPGDDGADGIAVDASGGIYVTGGAAVAGFPITPGAFQETLLGGRGIFVAKIGPADNTPTGTNVHAQLTNAVALTFESVGTPGTTAVTRTDTGPAPPAGFNLGDPPAYYELSTTAAYAGSITVCINYSGISFGDELNLKLLHFEGAGWIDRTTSLDTTNKIICAAVTSLSPFVILQPPLATVQPPIEPDGSSVFNVKRGVVPVKFTLATGGISTCALPPATISLARTAGVAAGPIDESIYLMASDAGSNFRVAGCQYEYNLGTKALGPGTYQVNILIGNVVVGSATFGLK